MGRRLRYTGAELVVKALQDYGIEHVFGYPGGAILPVYNCLPPRVHILVRHEQGAIHAAEGYARASGKIAVVLTTSGPGATNLVTGLADAFADSTPLLCITGQVPSYAIGTKAFQETDIITISKPITKASYQITKAEQVYRTVIQALHTALEGRPGPVLIDITKDAQLATSTCQPYRLIKPVYNIDVTEAANIINQAHRPLILAGQGVLISNADITPLVSKGLPVVCTLLGLSCVPVEQCLGMIGLYGSPIANEALEQCDVLLVIGARMDERAIVKSITAKVIHVDIDSSEIGRLVPTVLGIVSDASLAIRQLTPVITSRECWRQPVVVYRDYKPIMEMGDIADVLARQSSRTPSDTGSENVLYHCSMSLRVADDPNIVTDIGQHQMVMARYYPYRRPRCNITSGGHGTMGFALPAAIGAYLATRMETIAVIGDGSFQMTLQELATVHEHKLPIKIIVVNNSRLGLVRQLETKPDYYELTNPDFVALANSYSISADRVSDKARLSEAIHTMLTCEGPYLLEVVVDNNEII